MAIPAWWYISRDISNSVLVWISSTGCQICGGRLTELADLPTLDQRQYTNRPRTRYKGDLTQCISRRSSLIVGKHFKQTQQSWNE